MTQTLRHNRKTAYRLSGWFLLLAVFFAAAAFTGCDPALFFARKAIWLTWFPTCSGRTFPTFPRF